MYTQVKAGLGSCGKNHLLLVLMPFSLDKRKAIHEDDQGMVFYQNLFMGDSLDY